MMFAGNAFLRPNEAVGNSCLDHAAEELEPQYRVNRRPALTGNRRPPLTTPQWCNRQIFLDPRGLHGPAPRRSLGPQAREPDRRGNPVHPKQDRSDPADWV